VERLEHWATRSYDRFLISRAFTPYKWGENDCALFVADGIEAITGVDIAADFRGKYDDQASAMKAIKTIAKGKTIADAIAFCAAKYSILEWHQPLFAQRGDIATFNNEGRLICGLIHLNGRDIVAPGDSGLQRFPITLIDRAWHV
jgi:hypothetical protein